MSFLQGKYFPAGFPVIRNGLEIFALTVGANSNNFRGFLLLKEFAETC